MTREEAIKILKENCCAMCAYTSRGMDSCGISSCDNRDAIQALEQKWIPVSERLPEDHKDVLICLSSDQICIGCYNSHRLPFSNNVIGWGASYVHNWCSNDVIAWLPLPEPYTEVGE